MLMKKAFYFDKYLNIVIIEYEKDIMSSLSAVRTNNVACVYFAIKHENALVYYCLSILAKQYLKRLTK